MKDLLGLNAFSFLPIPVVGFSFRFLVTHSLPKKQTLQKAYNQME